MYSFGRTSFANYAWIKNGDLFSDVSLVEVEMLNAGAFRLEVIAPNGATLSVGERTNDHGGWHTFDFLAGMNPPVVSGMSPYKLMLVNRTAGTRVAKQGQVSP